MDPCRPDWSNTAGRRKLRGAARILLWKAIARCTSVSCRAMWIRCAPSIRNPVIVHPSAVEVCQKADALDRPSGYQDCGGRRGSMFAIGTEIHLVNRLARRFAEKGKRIITLDDTGAFAPPLPHRPQHLVWRSRIDRRAVVNQLRAAKRETLAKVALDRMLEVETQHSALSNGPFQRVNAGCVPGFVVCWLEDVFHENLHSEEAHSLLPVLDAAETRHGKQGRRRAGRVVLV